MAHTVADLFKLIPVEPRERYTPIRLDGSGLRIECTVLGKHGRKRRVHEYERYLGRPDSFLFAFCPERLEIIIHESTVAEFEQWMWNRK